MLEAHRLNITKGCVCVCAHEYRCTWRSEASDLLALELQQLGAAGCCCWERNTSLLQEHYDSELLIHLSVQSLPPHSFSKTGSQDAFLGWPETHCVDQNDFCLPNAEFECMCDHPSLNLSSTVLCPSSAFYGDLMKSTWWSTLASPTPVRLRLEVWCKFEASPAYIEF